MGHVLYNVVEVNVTPTLDTSAYTSGDRLGSIQVLGQNVARDPSGYLQLVDIAVIDTDKQSQAIDFMFFDQLPTVASADNAAIDIADAQMLNCVGVTSIAAADYKALAASSFAGLISTANRPHFHPANAVTDGARGLWVVMVCRSGTPTYTASGMKIRYRFRQY